MSRRKTGQVIRHLVEEHILPVSPFRCKLLHDPLWADAMLGTQLFPELKTDCRQTGEATVVYILKKNRCGEHISPSTTAQSSLRLTKSICEVVITSQ